MDRRSWPWRRKSSSKTESGKTVVASDSAGASFASDGSQCDQVYKKVNYVQISTDSYSHFIGLEDQIKTMGDQVKSMEDQKKELTEKLSIACSEIITKDIVVKQHAKVAEEAVSGWEKAEAEALALKHQLESITLMKLTAEDQASHLDGALKECMRQIRNLKEEHEQKLHDVLLTKTRQWDKIKLELEAKVVDLDQELLRSSAENAALSRSLQDRSNTLLKINEERSQAEAEIELLKSNIQSCEKEINSLKYELHMVSKELEIRNEEKNMCIKSAEAANKQHSEGIKKTAKLEAECQRLRGLVRKKLPGPAAVAQMRLEVENSGWDYGATRLRRSPVTGANSQLTTVPDFSLENVQQCHKETEFLTARLLVMEEETKMLKEALAKRNSELLASRNICAKTASRLRSLEARLQNLNQQRSSLGATIEIPSQGSLGHYSSNPPSFTSMSEDGIDEEGSGAESCLTVFISELSHLKKEENIENSSKADNKNHLELMDDFLEMERLACLSSASNEAICTSDNLNKKKTENVGHGALVDMGKCEAFLSKHKSDMDAPTDQISLGVAFPAMEVESEMSQMAMSKLQRKLSLIFDSQPKGIDLRRLLEDIKCALEDVQDNLPQQSMSCRFEEINEAAAKVDQQDCRRHNMEDASSGIFLTQDCQPGTDNEHAFSQELVTAISQIHDFVVSLSKETAAGQETYPDGHELSKKVEEFSATVNSVLYSRMGLSDFVIDLSHVLANSIKLHFADLGYKDKEGETNSSDCIDKVTLLEKKIVRCDSSREKIPEGCSQLSRSACDPEVFQDGQLNPGLELNSTSCNCLLTELEQLKSEKYNIAMDLARCSENLENTKFQLHETEQLLAEVRSQLASSQNSNSLAETQLKCMAESYKSLETREGEFEAEVNLLKSKMESLGTELQEEKRNHQDALARCKDLQEKMQRNESCSTCALSSGVDLDNKTKQDREIAAAAEKLAECQETIFLLGRQLKSLHPPMEPEGSPYSKSHQAGEGNTEDEQNPSSLNPISLHGLQDLDQIRMDSAAMQRVGGESPSDMYNSPWSPSDAEANLLRRSPMSLKRPKHRSTRSTSSAPTPEKNSHGFSRFFSSKSKGRS